MNVNEILENPVESITTDEIKNVFDQMKEKNFFDLDNKQRLNLIDFICEKSDKESAIDYLFHVLDNEISYPIDDEKVKILFDDDRMKKMKDLMVEQLQDEETVDVSDED
jgi:hypothetical protein